MTDRASRFDCDIGVNLMDKKTAKALEKSIKHWEEERDEENPLNNHIGIFDCALCDMFYDNPDSCCGCPIAEHTEQLECRGSPYQRAWRMRGRWCFNPELKDARAAWQAAAQKMIDFMKSLREPVK